MDVLSIGLCCITNTILRNSLPFLKKEKVINEVKKLIPTYVKGNSAATEKIAVNYQKAVENSKKTVKALLPDGLPGIDDTDVRNQWLNTKSVTFSNVYEAIEFLQNCG